MFQIDPSLFQLGPINPWLIATITIIITAILGLVINQVIKAHRKQAATGREELNGKTALVKTVLDPVGMVLFKGERWTAESTSGRIEPGESVIIDKVDSLKLYVSKKE